MIGRKVGPACSGENGPLNHDMWNGLEPCLDQLEPMVEEPTLV